MKSPPNTESGPYNTLFKYDCSFSFFWIKSVQFLKLYSSFTFMEKLTVFGEQFIFLFSYEMSNLFEKLFIFHVLQSNAYDFTF